MIVIIVCTLLAVAGLVLVVALGGIELQRPEAAGPAAPHTSAPAPATDPEAAPAPFLAAPPSADTFSERVSRALPRYAWWATVVTVSGVASGILLAGAGGRLVMRVLASTTPHAAGRITEAQAVVGSITPEGTIAFLLFGALPGAFVSAILFALVHQWLPRGRFGGVVFGVLLLVLFAATLEPLRAGNVDFDIVGPGWLAAALFAALVVLHGMLVAAIAGWYSLRLPPNPRRVWAAYSPLIAAVVYVPAGIVLAVGAVLTVIGTAFLPTVARWWCSPAAIRTGRIALAVLVVLAIPGFVGSVVSIVGR